MNEKIITATVDWSNSDNPVSSSFDDLYFSENGGIEEATFVFLEKNNLPDRWLKLADEDCFVIAETGFGTGLNFLVTLDLWQKLKAKKQIAAGARLHFISAEKHPLTKQDIQIAWQNWPEFESNTKELLQQYPMPSPGFHRLNFKDVDLTLLYRDATLAFADLEAKVDCWYLDGFSPAKNPDMWQQDLYNSMAGLSHANTSFSTFTEAGYVHDGLRKAGFQANKTAGFGKKRNMLYGTYKTPGPQLPVNKTPWFDYQQTQNSNSSLPVAVIGAGVAGCSTSSALIRRGYNVDLIEQQDYSAGPPPIKIQGVLYVKLSSELTPHSEFYSQGFLYSLQRMSALPELEWNKSGVIQSAFNDTELSRQQKFLENSPYPEELIRGVTAEESTDISGIEIENSGLYFPSGAWVNPISLCQNLMAGSNLRHNTRIESVEQVDGDWYLHTDKSETLGPYQSVVVACSNTAATFEQFSQLPVKPIRGQKSFIQLSEDNLPLKTVLCGKAYITPAINQQINFGATFNLGDSDPEVRPEDHETNRDAILNHFPALDNWLNQPISMGIVGFRCTSSDYTPLIGPVPEWTSYSDCYKDIGRFKKQIFPKAPLNKGLYCNIGHGSRGLSSALLAGELLACQISGEPLPVPRSIANSLNPARFVIKKLKKGIKP